MKSFAGRHTAMAATMRPVAWAAERSDALPAEIGQMIDACARYAETYAELRRQPVGCDVARGPILLEVLHGIAALAGTEDARDEVRALISDHALDLEE